MACVGWLLEIDKIFDLNLNKKIHTKNATLIEEYSGILISFYLLFVDDSGGFDGGGASLIPPGGGGNAPVAPVRVRRVDSVPSFFYKYHNKHQINSTAFQ